MDAINETMVVYNEIIRMPTEEVTKVLECSILRGLAIKDVVAAELRRLQRAIGMSTWDLMTCHNTRGWDSRPLGVPSNMNSWSSAFIAIAPIACVLLHKC